MLRLLSMVALACWVGVVGAAPRITSYQASCQGCGEKRVEMGSHSFCALSSVHSGGFDSSCSVGGSPKSWHLVAVDRDGGETQFCAAVCMDLGDSSGSSDTVIAPPPPQVSRPVPPPEEPKTVAAPESLGPYKTDFGTLTMRRSGDRVSGTYTHKEGRLEGTLSGNTLTGRWTQSNGKGRLIFRFNADFSGFTGVWSYGDAAPDRQWNGRR
ncbi:MAG: hypothetical protein IPO43_14275 [Rhodoferax sp.]|nr:hypothetical protein [Rhodoferax sp.]